MDAVGTDVFVFGGMCGSEVYNDTWKFDTKTNLWSLCVTFGDVPSPRCAHATAIHSGCIYVYGGMCPQEGGAVVHDTLYRLDTGFVSVNERELGVDVFGNLQETIRCGHGCARWSLGCVWRHGSRAYVPRHHHDPDRRQ